MANTILTKTEVTREALRILHNNLAFVKGIDRQYDDSFARTGAKIGSTLKIRLPNRYTVRTGDVMSAQDTEEESVSLVVATKKGVDLNFSSTELSLSIDDFGTRILKPAMSRLASEIDIIALTEAYQGTFNQVGTPGTAPATALIYLNASQKLDEFGAPQDDQRYACINPAAQAATVDGLKGLFHSGAELGNQYRKGTMGNALGLMFAVDQNIQQHTCGDFAGTTLVDDLSGIAEGDTAINVDAFTESAPTVKKGDIFTVAGVNAVNPETGQDTGSLQQFVVTADTTGASNEIDIPISPTIRSTGARKSVTALPANNAAVTFVGTKLATYPINLIHHKEAYTMATADLPLDDGADFCARETYDGISMRVWRAGDIVNDKFPCRIDILFGVKTVRPELGCRLIG